MMGAAGAEKSASAMRHAADQAKQTALELDNRARADMSPFRELGIQSGNMLSQALAGNVSLDNLFKGSSLYDWESEMGSRNVDRQLKARGMYNSGAGLETLAMFEKGLVAEQGNAWWDKLFNTTALGENAAARMATGTTQTGSNVANLQAQSGIAQGAAVQNQYNALGSIGTGVAHAAQGALNTGVQYSLYKPMLDNLGGRGGARYGYTPRPEMDFDTSWME